MAINKTLFEDAGVEPPTWKYGGDEYLEKWSYPQYLEVAQKLTEFSGGKPVQFGTTATTTYWMRPILTSKKHWWMNEDASDFIGDDPDVIDTIQWLADVRLVHEAAPTAKQMEGGAFDYPVGKLAMYWAGAFWLCYGENRIGDRFDWDVAAPPYWPGAEEKNPGGAYHNFCFWCLNPNSKVKEAAWSFYHFLSGPGGMRVPAELAWGFPLHRSLDPPVFGKRIPAGRNTALALDLYDSIPGTKGDFYPAFMQPNFRKCWDEVMSPEMDEVFIGLKTAEEAITNIAPKMDEVLKEGKQQMAEWGLA
jgi:multiple sugar transport system substrate-binding protein